MSIVLSVDEVRALVERILLRHGMSARNAAIVAGVVTAAERDGTGSHGLLRVPGYVSTLKSGWVDGAAVPEVEDVAPSLVAVDARNGFSQVALEAGRALLLAKVAAQGLAAIAIRNSHHFAALWPDVEPFAEAGYVALAMVNTRSHMASWDGKRKLIGTNPMAFACPRAEGAPLVWDQAASIRSQGEVLLAARDGRALPPGIGIDGEGRPTSDPAAILGEGALLPMGGHKGSAIALMVEVMAAALSGGKFGFEDRSRSVPGANTTQGGEFILVVDPARTAGEGFARRIEALLAALRASGVSRLPAERRYRNRRRALADGIAIADAVYRGLVELAGEPAP